VFKGNGAAFHFFQKPRTRESVARAMLPLNERLAFSSLNHHRAQ
jgi:hypothetical protein